MNVLGTGRELLVNQRMKGIGETEIKVDQKRMTFHCSQFLSTHAGHFRPCPAYAHALSLVCSLYVRMAFM